MKKSLIALAALAATGAFAQSSVTISGNLDFAGSSTSASGALVTNKGKTFSTTTGTSSTSVLRFIAVEDLGGGMKATAQYNFDPRTLSNDSLSQTNNSTVANGTTTPTAGALGNTATGLARDELFVGLSGGFGNLRLGSPNSIGLNSFQVASPLGTGIGSGYAPVAATMTNSYLQTRYSRSARYDSPAIAGFTASVLYAPGNDQAAVAAGTPATAGSLTALVIPDARKATEFGLNYAAGPLSVSYANVAQAKQTNATGFYSSTTLANSAKTSVNMLNASYALGDTTLYAGWNKGDALTAAAIATKTKGIRLAAKQTMGAVDLIAQYTEESAMASTAAVYTKSKVTGLRADYNLSKTAAVYAGYEKWDTGSVAAGDRKIASVGLRKSF